MPDRVRAELAPAQPRRQLGGRAGGRLVARAVVVGEVVGEELAQPGSRRRLARLPRLAKAAGPVRTRRQQTPVVEVVARAGAERGPEISRGSGSGARGGGHRPAGAPEGREHRVRRARARSARSTARTAGMPRRTPPSGPSSRSDGLERGIHLALGARRSAGSSRRRRPRHPSRPPARRAPPVRAAARGRRRARAAGRRASAGFRAATTSRRRRAGGCRPTPHRARRGR